MFYSHTYLRRNGRFGLIWLAATQTKVLSKRELYAIDISMTCSDILSHIPGYVGKEAVQRPRRFSLYLTSQLMYGSVRVLQKQWEYLFLDVSALLRKCHPEITSDIDLIMLKQDPATIASCVPTSKDYDPFFGNFKEATVDVEAILDIWDSNYLSKYVLGPSQPDIESPPSSVADRMDIQIRESHVSPIEAMLPGEQDLPLMDIDNLELLSDDVNLSVEELLSPQVSRILAATDITQTQISVYGRASLEETPAVRTAGEMPSTPQKPKRKRRHDVPEGRRVKHRAIEQEGLPSAAEEQEVTIGAPTAESRPEAGAGMPRGHDWLQQQPVIQLSPVIPSPSPVRRRRSRKLIVDQKIQMSREDIKHNMLTSDSTTQPLVLPSVHETPPFKVPGSQSLKHPALIKLWSRNCKFGLRIYDTETESSPSAESPISPLPPAAARERVRHKISEVGTPVEQILSAKSLSLSVERGRDVSAASASFEGDRSRSLTALASDESQAGLRKRKSSSESETSGREHLSLAELEQTGDMAVLPTWPEEQEHMISPIPLLPESDLRAAPTLVGDLEDTGRTPAEGGDTPRTRVLRLVTTSLRTADDWTTFRTICPPESFNRNEAARLFLAVCCQTEETNGDGLYLQQRTSMARNAEEDNRLRHSALEEEDVKIEQEIAMKLTRNHY